MAEPQTRPRSETPGDRTHASAAGGPGAKIRRAWARWSRWPGGRWLFSRMVGWMAPYTGSIKARVEELGDGHAVVTIKERRSLRNPFRSIHAVALLNLAEEASGLATLHALPAGCRGIVTALAMEYEKKARGVITAVCDTLPPATVPAEPVPHVAVVTLTDEAGDLVARAEATWTLAPARS